MEIKCRICSEAFVVEELGRTYCDKDECVAFEKALNTWRNLYRTFNDDNIEHCENALQSQGFRKIRDVIEANKNWIKEIRKCGYSKMEILEQIPEAEEYFS